MIEQLIRSHHLIKRANQLSVLEQDIIEKGYPIGTVRVWKDGKNYRKIEEGKWVPVNSETKGGTDESTSSIDLSEVKAYSKASKYWAKEKAKKIGGSVFEIGGNIYLLEPSKHSHLIKQLEENGQKEPISPKKSGSTTAEWKAAWDKMSEESAYQMLISSVENMSQESFEGFIESDKLEPVLEEVLKKIDKDVLSSDDSIGFGRGISSFVEAQNDVMILNDDGKLSDDYLNHPSYQGSDFSNVSAAQRICIRAYSSNLYLTVNRYLTGKAKYNPPAHLEAFVKRVNKTIDLGLENIKENDEKPFAYRAYKSRTSEDQREKEYKEKMTEALLNVGSEITFNTITSTSKGIEGAPGVNSKHTILYFIKRHPTQSKGKYIAALSNHRSEHEILFPSDAKFKITKVERRGSTEEHTLGTDITYARSIIHLEEVV